MENLRLNHPQNVVALNVAVATTAGPFPFHYFPARSLGSSLLPRSGLGTREVVTVSALTLERILDQARLPRVDLLKCDIEGAEFDVVPHLPAAVLQRIGNLALEYHLWRPRARAEELIAPLTAAGFALLQHLRTPLGRYLKMRNTRAV